MKTDPINPFPGLRSYQQEEDYLFFGREDQTAELLRRLNDHRFLAVVGTSGSGKSSLVRAGLLPALQGGNLTKAGSSWEVAVLRPGGDPISNLAQALVNADLHEPDAEHGLEPIVATLRRSGLGLTETVRQSDLESGANLLIVVDQFEEIFRFSQTGAHQEETAAAFVELLLEASRSTTQRIYICITMRSDYLGDCSQFRGLPEAVNEGEYLIPRLNRQQRRAVIEGPIRVGGAQITPRLLQTLLNDVGDNPDQLPILQHALMRTWDHWRDHHEPDESIDLRHYQDIGGMDEAMSRHADEVFSQLPSGRARTLAERLFRALTERGADNRGIRCPTRLNRLQAILEASPDELAVVINAFRRPGVTFLMPALSTPLTPDTVIDISHESLMRVWKRLDQWVEQEAQSARIYRRLIDTAHLHAEGRAGLYHDPDLQIALSWKENNQPNSAWADRYGGGFDLAMQFLKASRDSAERIAREKEAARQRELKQAQELAEAQRLRAEEQQRSARVLKKWMLAVAAVAVIALIASVIAGLARNTALKNEAEAQAARKVALEAKETLRQELYLSDLNQVRYAYEAGNIRLAVDLLSKHYPDTNAIDLRGFEWFFWWRATHRELAKLGSSTGPLSYLAVSADQKLAATVGWPGAILVMDTKGRQIIKELWITHESGIETDFPIAFSPDGQTLVSVGPDPLIRRWSTATWERILPDVDIRVDPHNPEKYRERDENDWVDPTSTTISPDGSTLALAASINGEWQIQLWNTSTWKAFDTLRPDGNSRIGELAFSPDGKTLATTLTSGQLSGSTNEGLLLWNQTDRSELKLRPASPGRSVAFSPNGDWLASGHANGSILLWPTGSLDEPIHLADALPSVVTVAFSKNNTYLAASTDRDNGVRIWDLSKRKLIATIKGHAKEIDGLAFIGDGPEVWTAGNDSIVKVWDPTAAEPFETIPGTGDNNGLVFLTGGIIASGNSVGAFVRLYNPTDDAGPVRQFAVANRSQLPDWNQGERFRAFAASDNGRFFVGLTPENVLRAWNVETRQLLGSTNVTSRLEAGSLPVLAVANTGGTVAMSQSTSDRRRKGRVVLWNVLENRFEPPLPAGAWTAILAFSPDGTQLAANGLADFRTTLWDLTSTPPRERATIDGRGPDFSLAYSPDGHRIAFGSWQNTIRLHDARTGDSIGTPLQGHAGYVSALAFSQDGSTLFSGGGDGTIRIWNSTNGVLRSTIQAHQGLVISLAVDPEGRWIASSATGLEEPAKIWKVTENRDIASDPAVLFEQARRRAREQDYAGTLAYCLASFEARSESVPLPPSFLRITAGLFAELGDTSGFHKWCDALIQRENLGNPWARNQLAITILTLQPRPEHLEWVEKQLPYIQTNIPKTAYRWFLYVRGLAEYRGAHYQSAVDSLIASEGTRSLGRFEEASRIIVLAMALHKLNQTDRARDLLNQAREMIGQTKPSTAGQEIAFDDWERGLQSQALLREATTLMGGSK